MVTRFPDTTVLVPVFLPDHPPHSASMALFLTCDPANSTCAAHSLAEVYLTLTKILAPHRASPKQALQCVEKIADRLRLASLDGGEMLSTIGKAVEQGDSGGTIYDAPIARCAVQSGAARIYIWNLRHFEQFGEEVQSRLMEPTTFEV